LVIDLIYLLTSAEAQLSTSRETGERQQAELEAAVKAKEADLEAKETQVAELSQQLEGLRAEAKTLETARDDAARRLEKAEEEAESNSNLLQGLKVRLCPRALALIFTFSSSSSPSLSPPPFTICLSLLVPF
jgi:septal ring factor EnvC (AmiA/AmiB activator)